MNIYQSYYRYLIIGVLVPFVSFSCMRAHDKRTSTALYKEVAEALDIELLSGVLAFSDDSDESTTTHPTCPVGSPWNEVSATDAPVIDQIAQVVPPQPTRSAAPGVGHIDLRVRRAEPPRDNVVRSPAEALTRILLLYADEAGQPMEEVKKNIASMCRGIQGYKRFLRRYPHEYLMSSLRKLYLFHFPEVSEPRIRVVCEHAYPYAYQIVIS